MRRDLTGKRIIITGASSGIGRALAEKLGARGSRLMLLARSEGKLAGIADSIDDAGGECHWRRCDVTDEIDRSNAFAAADDLLGGLDVLVNNAGVAAHGHFVDLTPEILRRVMEVNFFATAECCRLAIPRLARGDDPAIVNVASRTGRRGLPGWCEYAASKFAVCGFSESLRAELARFDVELTLVVPGLTASSLGGNLLARRGRKPIGFAGGLPPERMAERIVRAVERRKAEIRVGRDARLLLWLDALFPRLIDRKLHRIVADLYPQEIADLRAERRYRADAATASSRTPTADRPSHAPQSA